MDVGQMRKGTTRLILLKVLADANGPLHGYAIVRRLRACSQVLRFPDSMVYPTLHHLEREGLIVGRWVERSDGPRRKVYELTEAGRRELEMGLQAWQAVRRDVDKLLGLSED